MALWGLPQALLLSIVYYPDMSQISVGCFIPVRICFASPDLQFPWYDASCALGLFSCYTDHSCFQADVACAFKWRTILGLDLPYVTENLKYWWLEIRWMFISLSCRGYREAACPGWCAGLMFIRIWTLPPSLLPPPSCPVILTSRSLPGPKWLLELLPLHPDPRKSKEEGGNDKKISSLPVESSAYFCQSSHRSLSNTSVYTCLVRTWSRGRTMCSTGDWKVH